MQIMGLTKRQEELFSVYVDKWIKIGLDCSPADKSLAEHFAIEAYKIAKLSPPSRFIWALSPIDCIKKQQKMIPGKTHLELFNSHIYGQHDASWLSFYDYCDEVLHIDCSPLYPLMNLARHCGWWVPYENVCFLQEKAKEIHLVNGVLHNPSGPSILYGDGFSIYTLNGVRMPEWVIKIHPDTTDKKLGEKIIRMENVQQRSEAIRRFGIVKIKDFLNSKILHEFTDPHGNQYKLLEMTYEGEKTGPWLEMTDPSTGAPYIEGVGDLNNPWQIKTCQEALAWKWGMDKYVTPEVLT